MVRELSLACCAASTTTQQRHVLRALEASQFKSAAELCLLCQRLSPGLADHGVFAAEGGIGTSLRAFLCLALIHRASVFPEEVSSILPRIAQFQVDLLDEKAFSYYRMKSELTALQKKLTNRTVTVKPSKKDEDVSGDAVNDRDHSSSSSSCEELQDDDSSNGTLQNSNSKGGSSPIENGDTSLHEPDTSDIHSGGDSAKKLENGGNSHFTNNVTQKELTQKAELFSKPIESMASLVEERNRLVMAISKLEAQRTVVPSPVMGFMLLRTLCMELGEDSETAQQLISDISDKCLRLMR